MELDKPLYTVAEAAKFLAVSEETVRRMIADGELSGVKVRGSWRIKRESLEKYLL